MPLLIESGLHKRCDSVILVTANIETRYARIMKRDGLSSAGACKNCGADAAMEEKTLCGYIIENDTTEAELHLRVDELIGILQKKCGGK